MNTVLDTAALVDQYITKRADRLEADKMAAELKKEEEALKKVLLQIAIDGKTKSLGGSMGTLNYQRKFKPNVEDWDKLYEYIWHHRAFELLQKRVGEAAVKERWEDEIAVPGVVAFPVDDFTISGRK